MKGCNLTEPVYWNPLPLAAACVAARTGKPLDARGLVDLVAKRAKAGTPTQTIIKAVMPTDASFCLVAMPGHPERIGLLEGAEHARLTSKFGRLPGLAYIQEVRLQVIPLVANHLLELLLRGQTVVSMEYTTRVDECVFLMPFDGGRHTATIETCGINQRDLLSLMDSLACEAKPATPAPVEIDSASNAAAWTVRKPKRFNGYTAPLHRLLAAAHHDGRPCPTARDVVEAWRNSAPAEIAQVLPDGFNYYDAKGNTKTADLEMVRKVIGRMTGAR